MIQILLSLLLDSSLGWSAELDGASQEALQKTQEMLQDPKERNKAIQKDANAVAADQQVRSLAGSDKNTQEIYGLSSDILGDLAKQANGDPNKMLELIEKAKKDPEAFGKTLTPEQKRKLHELSTQIPAAQPAQSVPTSK